MGSRELFAQLASNCDVRSQSVKWCVGCRKFHRKIRIKAEEKFYLLSKGGKGPILKGIGSE
jgi:hypothetical protein